jgi:hypothetical protein
VPLEHDLSSLWADHQPVDQLRHQTSDDQKGLNTLFTVVPVGSDGRRGDERWVEVKVSKEESGRQDGGGGEVCRGDFGLEGAECRSGESAEGSVAGLRE